MTRDPYARLAEQLFPGGQLRRRWPLRGGVSASVEGLELALPDGSLREVVVRRHAAGWKRKDGDVAAIEHALHGALRYAGLPVPRPLHLDMSSSVLPSPFLVMELVDGTTEVAADDREAALGQMADFLVRLHALDPGKLALPPLPAGDALASLAPVAPSILHGDFWPGNVMWKDGRIAAVIDWEDATLGDAASDVACCRVELACAYGHDAAEAFTARYLAASSAPFDDARLAAWDVYVSTAALDSMAQWGLPAEVEARRRERTEAFLRACDARVRR